MSANRFLGGGWGGVAVEIVEEGEGGVRDSVIGEEVCDRNCLRKFTDKPAFRQNFVQFLGTIRLAGADWKASKSREGE